MDIETTEPPQVTVRDPAIMVVEAELLASSPERVYDWLRMRALKEALDDDDHDDLIEAALLARKEPLIDLALARYGIHRETLRTLFASTDLDGSKSLRVAVLSNEAHCRHGRSMSGGIVDAMIGWQTDINAWIAGLSDDELRTLFQNPKIGDGFLIEFLEQKRGWSGLDDRRRFVALGSLTENPRMAAKYSSTSMDGWREYQHGAVFNAAWKLAESVPVTVEWSHALSALYASTLATAFSMKEPLEIAKRWFSPDGDDEWKTGEQKAVENGYLGPCGRVRQQLGRLALGSPSARALAPMLMHEDVAIRAAAYRYGELSEPNMRQAAASDTDLAFDQLIRNDSLWSQASHREILREMAWAQPDPRSDLLAPNIYKLREADLKKRRREWFADEDRQDIAHEDAELLPSPLENAVAALSAKVDASASKAEKLEQSVATILERSKHLWWGLAGALAILLYDRL
jgi:hypothetical protein